MICFFLMLTFSGTSGLHGFVKEAPGGGLVTLGRQQEVDRLALLVYRTVPTEAHQNGVDWEAHPFGSQHRGSYPT